MVLNEIIDKVTIKVQHGHFCYILSYLSVAVTSDLCICAEFPVCIS